MAMIKIVSNYALPMVILCILIIGLYRDVKIFDVFLEGAREGITVVIKIIPPLVGLMVAIGVFRASGALDLVIYALKPITSLAGIPPEVLPLAVLRPVSGSASLAMLSDIIKTHGPDSMIGRMASTMMGSTETIFYTLTIYFGSIGVKNIRHTLIAALTADAAGVIASVIICRTVFGGS